MAKNSDKKNSGSGAKKPDAKKPDGKGAGKSGKKEPGISLSDVKEATNASKAAVPPVEDTVKPEVEILATNPAPAETPAPTETPVAETVTSEETAPPVAPVAEQPVVAEQPPVEEKAPAPAKEPNIAEQMLEKWLNGRRSVNHFELANSGVVNLNHFAMLDGTIGKFKFRRTYIGDNWHITVEE